MKRVALIVHNSVVNVLELEDDEPLADGMALLPVGSTAGPGWLWSGGNAFAPVDLRARWITKRAFIMRFAPSSAVPGFSKFDVLNTMLEDASFLSTQEPNAALRMGLKMLILKGRELYQQSPYVDLGGADTIQFINALAGSPVPVVHRLSGAEVSAFLNGPVADGDRFK